MSRYMDSGKVTSGSPRLAGFGEVTASASSWLLLSVATSVGGGSWTVSAVAFSFLPWRRLFRDGDLVGDLVGDFVGEEV